jgi:hypothetical protein
MQAPKMKTELTMYHAQKTTLKRSRSKNITAKTSALSLWIPHLALRATLSLRETGSVSFSLSRERLGMRKTTRLILDQTVEHGQSLALDS